MGRTILVLLGHKMQASGRPREASRILKKYDTETFRCASRE